MEKVAIVTGSGRGIGAATAKLLATQGYSVCVNYRSNADSANAVVAAIKASGGEAFALKADVSLERDVQALFDATEGVLGKVTHLVNNVTSCFLCSREFINRAQGTGAIVNVSSMAAKTGSPFEYVDYAASKGAVDTLTRGLALEVAAKGIRVNAVRPGFIHTDMHADGGEPDRVARLSPKIPMQRGGTPEEVANAIAWLLSDDASYATGTTIDVAGGK